MSPLPLALPLPSLNPKAGISTDLLCRAASSYTLDSGPTCGGTP